MKKEHELFVDIWLDTHCHPNRFINDPPTGTICADEPTTYAISIDGISPWRISSNIRRKLEETQCLGERRITCSISMSFFHVTSKKFYGSTFLGHEHTFTLKNLNEINNLSMTNLNELIYFNTRVTDPNAVLVCELVTSLYDQFGGGIEKRFGCGYGVICLFSDFDGELNARHDPIKSGSICIFDGSPRDLLTVKGQGGSIKQETKCMLSYRMWRCDGIGAVINTSAIIKENQIVGTHTKIAGLTAAVVNCFDDRGSSELPCIGTNTYGSILDWNLSPSDRIILAPQQSFSLENLIVCIPNRSGFEEACCQWVANTHPRQDAGVFGKMTGLLRNCSSPIKDNRSPIAVASRRVRVGAHNGHNFLRWYVNDLIEDPSTDDTLKLTTPFHMTGFADEEFVLVFVLEYTCQESVMKSPTKLPPRSFAVTVGSTVLSPINRESQSYFSLNLISDTRCAFLSSNTVFSPSNAAICSLSFVIKDEADPNVIDEKAIRRPGSMIGESKSLDGSSTSHFVKRERRITCHDEVKDDSNSFDSFPDTSALTFDETLVEEKDDSCDDMHAGPSKDATSSQACNRYLPSEYSVLTEVDDSNNATDVCIIMTSFTPPSIGQKVPQRSPIYLTFQMKLCEYEEIVTGRFSLNESRFSKQSRIVFEYQYNSPDHAKQLATYMLERPLFIEVFDDGKFHIGTIALPLHLLVRQGKPNRLLENISADIIAPRGIDCDGSIVTVKEGSVLPGLVAGTISLSIELKGKKIHPRIDEGAVESSVTKRFALNLLDTNQDLRILKEKLNCDGRDELQSSNSKENEQYRVESLLSRVRDITPQGPYRKERMLVDAAGIVREGMKQDVITAHISSSSGRKPKVISVRPYVGQLIIVEVEVMNPKAADETYTLESSHPGVSLVTSASEWDARRRGYGAVVLTGKEHLVQFDCMKKDQVEFKAHHTQVIPLVLDQRATDKVRVTVSFVSTKNQKIDFAVELDVTPLLRIDRRFIIPCANNENVKRSITFQSKYAAHNKSLTIKLIDQTTHGVKYEWDQASSVYTKDAVIYELTIRARCCEKSSDEVMYVVISNDHFTNIAESWKIVFEKRVPIYHTACLGARVRKEIEIKGGGEDSVVACRAMLLPGNSDSGGCMSTCRFERDSFQLKANETNRMYIVCQFQAAGQWKVLLNCLDKETGVLVQSFILSAQCYLPAVSKDYSIEAPLPGNVKYIKLPFTNCLSTTRIIDISSSNEVILLPQTPKLQLSKDETLYARFRVKLDEGALSEKDKTEGIDVFLFTRDLSTQTEDCVRIRIKIPKL